jgi:hypothetical protein
MDISLTMDRNTAMAIMSVAFMVMLIVFIWRLTR